MKQSLDDKQWDELSEQQKEKLFIFFFGDKNVDEMFPKPTKSNMNIGVNTIGRLTEFIGEDLADIDHKIDKSFSVGTYFSCNCGQGLMDFNEMELVDSLWEVVKYKLTNK